MSVTQHKIPLVVVTGFLGSGKTTLLRRWRHEKQSTDAVLIVQDFSELGVDAELISGDDPTPGAGLLLGRVAALHGNHARENLHASMGKILHEIRGIQPKAPLVLLESTGAAKPVPLWKSIIQNSAFSIRHWIVTVDSLNFHRDFADGEIFTGERPAVDDPALQLAASVMVEQLLFASVIVLTKTDTVGKSILDQQIKTLQKIQPYATIACSARSGLQLAQLDEIPSPKPERMEKVATFLSQQDHAQAITADVSSHVMRTQRPFHPQRLYDVCQGELGTGLYRTKGFLWMASRSDDVLLWQQAGSQVTLELMGLWRAGLLAKNDGTLLAEERDALLAALATQDPDFGDRHIELTLIGQDDAVKRFSASLMRALCNEEEVAKWKKGIAFPDPWPKNLRKQ